MGLFVTPENQQKQEMILDAVRGGPEQMVLLEKILSSWPNYPDHFRAEAIFVAGKHGNLAMRAKLLEPWQPELDGLKDVGSFNRSSSSLSAIQAREIFKKYRALTPY